MKIVHILKSNKYSGAENVAITIINKMKDRNDIVYVCPEGEIREYLKKYNINYEPVKKISVKEIKRIIKKYKPDIVHAHDFSASVISAIASNRKNVISHLHNNNPRMKKINLYSIIYLCSTLKYKKILMVSQAIMDEYVFRKNIAKNVEILGNPIELEKIVKLSKEYKCDELYHIAFLGRLSDPKQPEKFIQLIKELKETIKNIKAVMIGDGPLREKCEKIIKENDLEKNIILKGFIKNPFPILKNSKVVCMTSKYEGFGLAAIEALVLGKPVVATDVGGLPDIVNDTCGKIYKEIEEAKKEVIKLLDNEEYYKSKSLNAIKRSQEMNNIDEYINKLEKIYKQCIGKGE